MADKILHIKALVTRQVSDDTVEVVGSSSVLDRAGDIIDQEGWDLKNFKKNPVILWGHNVKEERPPIGKAVKVWIDGIESRAKKLMFKVKFDLEDSFAAGIARKVRDGFINTVSVGFLPIEWEELKTKDGEGGFGHYNYTKAELLELSFVPVPANPEAIVVMREMGIQPIELNEMYKEEDETDVTHEVEPEKVEPTDETEESQHSEEESAESDTSDVKSDTMAQTKGVIPYADHDTAPMGEGWDGPGETAKCKTVMELKMISTWFDSENAENKGAYKLPHHKQSDKKAVFRGVAAAMGALLGARGGVDIPDSDRKGVYNHLAKHYAQFDKEPPDFKYVEVQVLKDLTEEIQSVILEREDKYEVRLIKKLIKKVNDLGRPKRTPKPEEVKEALKIIDNALFNYKDNSELKEVKSG